MEILGQIGIDPKLLLAQVINFLILLFILTKFVYKPILKRIKEDEEKLAEAEKKRSEAEAQRTQLIQQAMAARQSSVATIQETEKMADSIRLEAKKKGEDEAQLLIEEAKAKAEEYQKNYKMALGDEIVKKAALGMKGFFAQAKSSMENLDTHFFSELIEKVSGLRRARADEVILSYVKKPTKVHLGRLKSLVEKKFGEKTKIKAKLNATLISGYSLEAGGVLIEANLANEIQKAIK